MRGSLVYLVKGPWQTKRLRTSPVDYPKCLNVGCYYLGINIIYVCPCKSTELFKNAARTGIVSVFSGSLQQCLIQVVQRKHKLKACQHAAAAAAVLVKVPTQEDSQCQNLSPVRAAMLTAVLLIGGKTNQC